MADRGVAYHCPTNEIAKSVLAKAHKDGHCWADNTSFLDTTEWGIYKENTCYDLKRGKFLELNWCKEEEYTIKQG